MHSGSTLCGLIGEAFAVVTAFFKDDCLLDLQMALIIS